MHPPRPKFKTAAMLTVLSAALPVLVPRASVWPIRGCARAASMFSATGGTALELPGEQAGNEWGAAVQLQRGGQSSWASLH